jgi:hypothetical protein
MGVLTPLAMTTFFIDLLSSHGIGRKQSSSDFDLYFLSFPKTIVKKKIKFDR